MLHNEAKVITQHPRDCVHTFIHLWNHKSTSMKKRTHKLRSKERLYARDRDTDNSHAQFKPSTHMLADTHSTCTREQTHRIMPWAQATFHILHFTGRVQGRQTGHPNQHYTTISVNPCNLLHLTNYPRMCGQKWGRRKDWQALIPASRGHCYCSRASQMSATWLILPLAASLPFHCIVWVSSFKINHPQMCSTNNSSKGSHPVRGRTLTNVWWKIK